MAGRALGRDAPHCDNTQPGDTPLQAMLLTKNLANTNLPGAEPDPERVGLLAPLSPAVSGTQRNGGMLQRLRRITSIIPTALRGGEKTTLQEASL